MSEPQRKSGPSILSIALFLGLFFLLVVIVSVLILPDHGRSLLKLASGFDVRLHAEAAMALLN